MALRARCRWVSMTTWRRIMAWKLLLILLILLVTCYITFSFCCVHFKTLSKGGRIWRQRIGFVVKLNISIKAIIDTSSSNRTLAQVIALIFIVFRIHLHNDVVTTSSNWALNPNLLFLFINASGLVIIVIALWPSSMMTLLTLISCNWVAVQTFVHSVKIYFISIRLRWFLVWWCSLRIESLG